MLQFAEPIDQVTERNERRDGGDIDQRAVEHEARLQRLAELVAAAQHAIEHLRDARAIQAARFTRELTAGFIRGIDQLGTIGRDLQHREVTQVAHDRARELDLVDAALDGALDRGQRVPASPLASARTSVRVSVRSATPRTSATCCSVIVPSPTYEIN
jgi:hypothetical protein